MEYKDISFSDIKPGDKVRMYRDVIVGTALHKGFYDKSGIWWSDFASYPHEKIAHNLQLIERPVSKPEHWPPQEGDVWRCKNGDEYYVLDNNGHLRIFSSTDKLTTEYALLSGDPVLVYRKGDTR